MQIIETPNLDLINPFPPSEIPRIFGWIAATQAIFVSDDSPKDREGVIEYLKAYLPRVESFGVVDRDNWLQMKHAAPLVGIVIFEPATQYNGYLHVACTRRARGTRVIDQALQGVIKHLFETSPLLRLSASVPETSYHTKSIFRRVGFKREALLPDMIVKEGQPIGTVHFGLLKRNLQWDGYQHWVNLVSALAQPLPPLSPLEQV